MSASSIERNASHTRPALTLYTLVLVVLTGAAGTLAFDLWGKAIAPLVGLGTLVPVGLARGFLGTLGLPNGAAAGNAMHLFVVGVVAYPVGWLFVARPLQRAVLPALPWVVTALVYGVALWAIAIGGIAWIAGNPPFLGFGTLTWNALAGHVIYALAAAAAAAWVERHAAPRPA